MNRSRIVAGSLLGAFIIHVVFVACSAQPVPVVGGDGGVVAMMLDAIGMQVRDANAQDASSNTCNCPPGPTGPMGPPGPGNVFAARLAVSGATCTIDRQTAGWLNECVRTGPGAYQLVVNPSVSFSAPVCTITTENGLLVSNVSPGTSRILVAHNASSDSSFDVICVNTM